MNDIESNYLAAASAYQAQQQNYLQAGKDKRLHAISEDDYRNVCNTHRYSQQALDHAEAAWVASWR